MQGLDSNASHTDWSMIVQAARRDEPAAGDALEKVVRRYWPAVYAYVRRSGRNVHDAADLTQGFVCDVILKRSLCAHADPARGRFRSLLLTAVRNYLRERHRHDTRARARHQRDALPLDEALTAAEPAGGTPEEAFSHQWGATLVHRVLGTVRDKCMEDGLEPHWTIFEDRVVRPMLMGERPVDYSVLVERLNLKDQSQAANMMITVKRRFMRALYDEVGETVMDPGQVDDELRELLRDLERPR